MHARTRTCIDSVPHLTFSDRHAQADLVARLLKDRPRITPENAHEWPPPYPLARHCEGAKCWCKPATDFEGHLRKYAQSLRPRQYRGRNPHRSGGRFVCDSPCSGPLVHLVTRSERLSWDESCSSILRTRVTRLYASEESEPLRWFAQMNGSLWLPLLPIDLRARCPTVPSDRPSGCIFDLMNRVWKLETTYCQLWGNLSQALRTEMCTSAGPHAFTGWGHEETPMLLPLEDSHTSDYRVKYNAAVRKWQRLYGWGEIARQKAQQQVLMRQPLQSASHDAEDSRDEGSTDEESEEDAPAEEQHEWDKIVDSWEDEDGAFGIV